MTHIDEYRWQARGNSMQEAALELLTAFQSGRFLKGHWPWLVVDEAGDPYIDWAGVTDLDVPLSSGECRVLSIAGSLGGGCDVGLDEVLYGLDNSTTHLVLNAFAHAMEAHRLPEPRPGLDHGL